MNAFNRTILETDSLFTDSVVESCDECNKLITNWITFTNSFITESGLVVCKSCKELIIIKSTKE